MTEHAYFVNRSKTLAFNLEVRFLVGRMPQLRHHCLLSNFRVLVLNFEISDGVEL